MNVDNNIAAVLQNCDVLQSSTFKQLLGKIPTVSEIEKESLVSRDGCTSEIIENNLSTNLSNLDISKKKKTRRKARPKKVSVNLNHEINQINHVPGEESLDINLKIEAVTSQTSGKIFRIKNCGCRHIHLGYYGDLKKENLKINTASHANKLIVPNDRTPKNNSSKSCSSTKNGTVNKHSPKLQFDNSPLQSPSLDMQNASASSSPKRKEKLKKFKRFQNYLPEREVYEGLASGALIKGVIRINPKNFREAYVSNEDRSLQDYLIQSVIDRNRALEGDVVAIQIKPESEWTEKQKTAVVVNILEQVHSRTAIGFLHPMPDKNKTFAAFIPRDNRVPRIKVPVGGFLPKFHAHPNRYENIMYKARINLWKEVKYAQGTVTENIGASGELESETYAILAEHNLNITAFGSNMLQFVPYGETITPNELKYRKDLRKECIFTIDPLTARDLDDAVSCKELNNGNLEIGVHISDVAFFLAEGTPLDNLVAQKATTIYLVNNVYHMLPQELCMMCSLLPGIDKRAFSVFWEMTKDGNIVNSRFGRTVINSCVQLAYEHAQMMIENPNREFQDGELPEIHGGYTYKELSKIVNYLQGIAVNLREKRFENGALRIDQTKLIFRIDENSGEPTECIVYENKEAHRLIEEFMLLANITVAEKILKHFPTLAFLRCHDPPLDHLLVELKKNCSNYGIDLDISSSKAIQASIWNVRDNHNLGTAGLAVIHYLLAKPMTRARYFCAGSADSYEKYRHFALSVPIYTHFTSPIRRYADIMVHRLLAACLGYCQKPQWTEQFVSSVANNCNKQKYNAKCAGDASSDLYLAHYVAEHQPFVQSAVVVDVKNMSFDILIVSTGTVIRMYPNNLGDNIECTQEQSESRRKFVVTFPETSDLPEESYVIQLFSILKVNLCRKPKTNKLEAKLLRPVSSQSFAKSN